MKNVIIVVLFLVPNLLHGQENKPKFYDRLQIVPEYQPGIYKYYTIVYNPYSIYESSNEEFTNLLGCGLFYKTPYFNIGINVSRNLIYENPIKATKLLASISGNLLSFTKAARNKTGLFFGPNILFGNLFFKRYTFYNDVVQLMPYKAPLIGIGADLNFYNIYLQFSYNFFLADNIPKTQCRNQYILFSIGYGIDMNLFRKKEKKRYDL
jgi:hypothetical protein